MFQHLPATPGQAAAVSWASFGHGSPLHLSLVSQKILFFFFSSVDSPEAFEQNSFLAVCPKAVCRLLVWSSRSAIKYLPVLGGKVRRVDLFGDDLAEIKDSYPAFFQVPDNSCCN